MIDTPVFKNREDKIDWYFKHQNSLKQLKKASVKHADFVTNTSFSPIYSSNGELKSYNPNTLKLFSNSGVELKENQLFVSAVINTTNVLDSHGDVHLDGLWNRSLKEKRYLYLNNNHRQSFEEIVSDEIKAEIVTFDFSELGYSFSGKTQALVFNAVIDEESKFFEGKTPLYKAYKNNKVKNHSVEMRYKDIELGINDDRYPENKAIFDEYIKFAYNVKAEDYKDLDVVWFIKQADVMGGAGVPHGSNPYTPTLNTEAEKSPQTNEQTDVTQTEQKRNFINVNLI